MANQFSEQQRKSILLAFQQLDTDGDGKLTRQEVAQLLKLMNYHTSQDDINKLIDEIDADNNGTIDPGEFLALMARIMLTITEEKDIAESFSILKAKHQDAITFESLKEVLKKMGEKLTEDDMRNMIEQADLDNDGRVTFQEFKKMLSR